MAEYTLGLWSGTGLSYSSLVGDSFTMTESNTTHTLVVSDDDAILNDWTDGNYDGTPTPGISDGDTNSVAVSSDIPGIESGDLITSGRWFELSYTNPFTGLVETVDAFLLYDDTQNTPDPALTGDSYVFTTTPLLQGVTYTVTSIDENAGVPWEALTPPCLARGTLVLTDLGERRVETIAAGDRVLTADNGICEVLWAGHRHLPGCILRHTPRYQPVRIPRGSLGHGQPNRNLTVSPQHRIALTTGTRGDQVFIPAKHLVGINGIHQHSCPEGITYHHVLLRHHHILTTNGAPTESLFLGPQALGMLSPAALREILRLFPMLADKQSVQTLCRPVVSRKEARKYLTDFRRPDVNGSLFATDQGRFSTISLR